MECATIVSSESRSSQRVTSVGRYLLGYAILSCYLLPNTLWASISPLSLFPVIKSGDADVPAGIVLLLLCYTMLGYYTRCMSQSAEALKIAKLFCPFMGLYCFTLLALEFLNYSELRLDTEQTSNCFLTVAAIVAGLTARALFKDNIQSAMAVCSFGFMQACYAIYDKHIHVNVLTSGDLERAGGTFDQPNELYFAMVVCLPFAYLCFHHSKQRYAKAVWIALSSVILAAEWITWQRAGIVAVAVGSGWILKSHVKRRSVVVLACLLLFAAGLLVVRQRSDGPVNRASTERSTVGRYRVWKSGLNVFREHWLGGVGIGAFKLILDGNPPNRDSGAIMREPKNILVFCLAETGVIGIVCLVFLVIGVVKALNSCLGDPTAQVFRAAWMAILAAGVFDTPFGSSDRLSGNMLFGYLLASTILLPLDRKRLM